MRMSKVAVVFLALPLLGMGALGGGGAATPERNYQGAFVDRDGTRVEAKWINAAGELALSGDLGRGTLKISFDDIRQVAFSGGGREPLLARVELRKGEPVELKLRDSLSFYGQTAVGQYHVRARDLKTVELQPE